jgi:large subunit ribosomal protein L24
MQGPPAKDDASKDRPEFGIVLKGALGAPERTLDVSALTTWLSLRRIEQQTKRIESLESGRKPNAPAADAGPATPPPAKPHQPASQAQPSPMPQTQPSPKPTHPSAQAQRPVAPNSSGSPAAGGQLTTLPPPIDIRPVRRGPRIESDAFR